MTQPAPGRVYLVGAGPGDPALLTLRGAECLRRADVVLYDYLVNPVLVAHCREQAERICLGKHGGGRIWPQEEINDQLVAFARAGKTVVRLKSGDPAIFARGAEEVERLVREGIEFEIVPGITAALAAGSYAGIPITHRELASAVALVTGHEDPEKHEQALDYAALAKFPGTLVFYMGVTTVRHWSAELMAAGKPAGTPVAVVRRCSQPDQRTLRTTLGEVAAAVERERLRPPVIFIIGDVAALAESYGWFEKRPLFGRKILVTRPTHQATALAGPLAELGADVLFQPAIEIGPPTDWSPVDSALNRLSEFDWLVFSSSNGVRYLLERLLATGRDLRALGSLKVAAIGPGTAEELLRYHLTADLVPDEFRAESLAGGLAGNARGQRFLLARASRGREVLAGELATAGGIVEQVVVYQSSDVTAAEPQIAELMAGGKIQWVTVTSSAIAKSLKGMFGESLKKTRLVSISPITSGTLRELGHEPTAEATQYTMAGVVEAIQASPGVLSTS
ncbi:MAG: uroporphyrinogen-III C-methyltransferase [Pirellulaceae bacterium]